MTDGHRPALSLQGGAICAPGCPSGSHTEALLKLRLYSSSGPPTTLPTYSFPLLPCSESTSRQVSGSGILILGSASRKPELTWLGIVEFFYIVVFLF